jgi:hypothetical protein
LDFHSFVAAMDVGELLDEWVENRCGPTNGMSFVFLFRQRPATGIHELNNTINYSLFQCIQPRSCFQRIFIFIGRLL